GFGIILVPKLARLQDWPVVRLPLSGGPAPVRRVLGATRKGKREHPLVTAAMERISSSSTLPVVRDGTRTWPAFGRGRRSRRPETATPGTTPSTPAAVTAPSGTGGVR